MNKVVFRKANVHEGKEFSELIMFSAKDIFAFLFGPGAQEFMKSVFAEPSHLFSYEHVWFAESDGRIAGMVLGYSGGQRKAEEKRTGFVLLKHIRLGILARLPRMIRMAGVVLPVNENEFYISNIAVYPDLRGQGIGSIIIEETEKIAREMGCRKIILDTEIENERAVKLYKSIGYNAGARTPEMKMGNKIFCTCRMYKLL